MKKIKIGDRLVGEGEPCFIIAEAGSNHDGKFEVAKRLIKVAKDVGADAIKFQTFKAEKLASPKYAKEMYKTLKKYELKAEWHTEFKKYADEIGIIFLSTPFDEGSADLLDKIGVPAFKVASGDLTHLPLLEYIAKKRKPMIVSTGGGSLAEVEEAINTIRNQGNNEIILMHCISNYPAKIEDANIRAMITMKNAFHVPVGYSDHSPGILIPIATATLGACVIEKHFTVDKFLPGPDHAFALEGKEIKEMVQSVRLVQKALGDGMKRVIESEKKEVQLARRSLVASMDTPKRTRISKEMIKIVRPGSGMPPKYIDFIVGKKTKSHMKEDELITWDKI